MMKTLEKKKIYKLNQTIKGSVIKCTHARTHSRTYAHVVSTTIYIMCHLRNERTNERGDIKVFNANLIFKVTPNDKKKRFETIKTKSPCACVCVCVFFSPSYSFKFFFSFSHGVTIIVDR